MGDMSRSGAVVADTYWDLCADGLAPFQQLARLRARRKAAMAGPVFEGVKRVRDFFGWGCVCVYGVVVLGYDFMIASTRSGGKLATTGLEIDER